MTYTCHTCLLDLRDRFVAFNAHQADWWPSSSEDCIFVAWQVDAQLLPRCLKRCPFCLECFLGLEVSETRMKKDLEKIMRTD